MGGYLFLFRAFDQGAKCVGSLGSRDAVFCGDIELFSILGIQLGLLSSGFHDGVFAILETASHDFATNSIVDWKMPGWPES